MLFCSLLDANLLATSCAAYDAAASAASVKYIMSVFRQTILAGPFYTDEKKRKARKRI